MGKKAKTPEKQAEMQDDQKSASSESSEGNESDESFYTYLFVSNSFLVVTILCRR